MLQIFILSIFFFKDPDPLCWRDLWACLFKMEVFGHIDVGRQFFSSCHSLDYNLKGIRGIG